MSDMLKAAFYYQELGWKIFPILPNDKRPATAHGVKDATNDRSQIEKWWTEAPNNNIGVALGRESGIYVIDVDFDKEKGIDGYESLLEFPDLPNTVTVDTPRGGLHAFFMTSGQPPKNSNNFRKGIEIKGDGLYVVLPPSVHPNGKRYMFRNGRGPTEYPLAEFPKHFRVQRTPRTSPTRGVYLNAPAQKDEGILKRAEAYLAACPPAIEGQSGHSALLKAANALVHGFCLDQGTAHELLLKHYNPRCQPPWNMRNPKDYKEFNRKVEEAASNPPNKPRGWLLESDAKDVDPEFAAEIDAVVKKETAKLESPPAQRIVVGRPNVTLSSDNTIAPPINPIKVAIDQRIRELRGEILSNLPGYVKKLHAWVETTSKRPAPWISLAVILTTLGAVLGRKITDVNGTRTNLYTLGVIDAGGGKQHAIDCMTHLLFTGGMIDILGGQQASSDIAIFRRLHKQPTILYLWDEIGHFFTAAKNKNAQYTASIVPALMTLYSKSSTVFRTKDYADVEKDLAPLIEPCVCLHGSTTPIRLMEGLDPSQMVDGWIARCLVFFEENMQALTLNQRSHVKTLDDGMVEFVRNWYDLDVGDTEPTIIGGEFVRKRPEHVVIPRTNKASEALQRGIKRFEDKRKDEPLYGALWSRGIENANKLALIAAAAENFMEPQIELHNMEWALSLTEYLILETIRLVVPNVVECKFDKQQQRVLNFINKKRKATQHEVSRCVRGFDSARQRKETLDDLQDQRLIFCEIETDGQYSRTVYYSLDAYQQKLVDEAGDMPSDATIAFQNPEPQLSSGIEAGNVYEGQRTEKAAEVSEGSV